ncbi:MAG: hypothetical protein WCP12_17185 [bacterium]
MTLKRVSRNGVVIGLVACVLIFVGCWRETERPLLPSNAFVVAYTTDATKDVPVMREFGRVFNAKQDVLSEFMKQLKPGSVEKIADDPFKTYLAIDRQKIEWSLVALGEIVRPAPSQDLTFPDLTWVLCGSFSKEKILAALTEYVQSKHSEVKLEASSLCGTPVWTLKGEAISKVRGLNPCLAFSGKRLMLVASNEKALKSLLDLYAGKEVGLPKETSLWRVLKSQPNLISRLMIVNINDVMNKLTTEAERKEMLRDPKMNAVVSSLRDLTIETRLVPSRDAAELVVRIECADEANAQTLCELCITAKTSASFLLNMAISKKPELKVVSEWLSKVTICAESKQTTLALRCSPQDIQNVDVKTLMERKGNKIKRNN